MPIYTRTGDKGKTSLFGGKRVLKSHQRVETYGTIDELNSMIGLAISEIEDLRVKINESKKVREQLEKIQHELFDIGSALSTPYPIPVIGLEKRPKEIEKFIDDLTEKLPEITAFILPGGRKAGSLLHVCRTIARRAERQVIALVQKEKIDTTIITYLNRLSDLFFTMARYVNHIEKKKEITWIKK